MKAKQLILALLAAGLLSALAYGTYAIGMKRGMQMASPQLATSETKGAKNDMQNETLKASSNEEKVLYWHDPMVPGQRFDKPGKSPFMDMQLVPVYAGNAADEGTVSISPRVQQNLGIRTAEVSQGVLGVALEAVGSVAYNERDMVLVQARSNGFVEKLYARAVLDPVKKGQPLVELYIPEWVAAQEEYLSIKKMGDGPGMAALLDGASQRMRLVGMNAAQIEQVRSSNKLQPRLLLRAPISGVISELSVREGMTVMAGAALFRLNAINTVWVNAEVPENQIAQLRPGSAVEVRSPSLTGSVFPGKISALLPQVNPTTRTVTARIELANPNRQLLPGMFTTVNLTPAARATMLLVPSEAVIQTGTRSVVMLAEADGKFSAAEVELGAQSNGQTEIRKGLAAGQKIVISGQFLIDSEASFKTSISRMQAMPAAKPDPANQSSAAPVHRGKGKVEVIEKGEITLSHGPIPSLQWGAMTMGFVLPAGTSNQPLSVGDEVDFEIRAIADGAYEVSKISPTKAGAAKASALKNPAKAGGLQ